MEDAGQKLRRARERLHLRVRDVEQASLRIAEKHKNEEFGVLISRISEIENRGLVPTLFKLYSLCAIYRLDYREVLGWYGIPLDALPADSTLVEITRTHPVGFRHDGEGDVLLPVAMDPGIDIRRTAYLSRMIQRWGKIPLMFLDALDLKNHRYAFIGTEDWFMFPLLQPGALVLIDESRRKVAPSGWTGEYDRPVYFVEHRGGYLCGWCSVSEGRLTVQPHPSSHCAAETFAFPEGADVIGQVVGAATRLDQARRRRARS